ncbi:MAG: PKD domain-containing protein [Chitinophagales bacterium]|nr:PKD domain-containing protein [Chitinophagales bacterium]
MAVLLLLTCGQLSGQCPLPSTSNAIFIVNPSELPCIQRSNYYHEFFSVYGSSLANFITSSLSVDSVVGLPDGITYQVTQQSSSLSCIELTGVTFDSIQTYSVEIYGNFQLHSFTNGTVFNQTGKMSDICIGIPFAIYPGNPCSVLPKVQVINPGDTCCSLSSQYNRISGATYLDVNVNGIFDSADYPMGYQQILIDSNLVFSNSNGEFEYETGTGNYAVSMNPPLNFSLTNNPSSYSISIIDTCSATFTDYDFGLTADTSIDDASINLIIGPARPGFQVSHYLSYKNIGTTVLSDTIILAYDTALTFLYASQPFISHLGNELKWTYSALTPGSIKDIRIYFQLPANIALLNDTLFAVASIGPVDNTLINNISATSRVISGSFDPNNKILEPETWNSGMRPEHNMRYTINFQNTGTDTAFIVEVRDTLSEHLDISTFEPVAQSHAGTLVLKDERILIWTFYNILLPDSHTNEPASHGFIQFDIQPQAQSPHGLVIENRAAIYFDYNPPIITGMTRGVISLIDTSCFVQLPDTLAGCVGQYLELKTVGGMNPIWSDGQAGDSISITITADALYSVFTSSGNCIDSASVFVKAHSLPVASILIDGIYEICTGDTLSLTAAGGISYLWNNGESTSTIQIHDAADYTVTVLNSIGCTDTAVISISAAGNYPVADFDFLIKNDSVQFENQSADGIAYQWNLGNGEITNEVSPNHIFSYPGTFEVCLVVNNYCGVDSVCKMITVVGDTADVSATFLEKESNRVAVFPNPADEIIHVSCLTSNISRLILTDISGRLILQTTQTEISITHLASGLYFVRIELTNGSSIVRKIVMRNRKS